MKSLALATGLAALAMGGAAFAQSIPSTVDPAPPISPAEGRTQGPTIPLPTISNTPPRGAAGPLDGLPSTGSGTMNPPPGPDAPAH